ncbi:MAG: YlmC/YmxH family sporulation protein [Ruminococcaceae bacterium]|nr:YlmC/YmxH family sporulation protein [Oscillospiraceae bacterium]
MFKASQFGKREIINLTDGERMGYVCDLEIDEETGKINALIVPAKEKVSVFSKGSKITIPWQSIKKIGDDIILVNL